MAMTSVDIDDEALEQASRILGTKTKRDTLNAALREVIRARAAAELVEFLSSDAIEYRDHRTLRRDSWGYSAAELADDE
jgi:Arc/MetJ family transcription regulator